MISDDPSRFISDYPLYSKSFQFEFVSDFEFMATIGWEGLMLKEARRERIEKIELFEWEEGRLDEHMHAPRKS